MPGHWTYDSYEPADELEQGDILSPTSDLRDIFAEVHPHFSADNYLGFMVATQSCDLVRRHSSPKAAYIALAAIRPLGQVLSKVIGSVARPLSESFFKTSDRAEARRLLERILNQNEQTLGLFFLFSDAQAGIAEPAVAFLRVTVALRAEHYERLRAARVGRLTPEFRAKLGWLIGNLYVRPATPDWGDTSEGKKRFDDLIRQHLDEANWIDDEIVAAAATAGVDIGATPREQLETLRPPSRLERALSEVDGELTRVAPELDETLRRKLANRLRNSGKFKKLFK